MGGSGGGFFSGSTDPSELARRTREAQEKLRDEDFEIRVGGFLAAELAAYNDRDASGTQAVFDNLKTDLKEEFEGTVNLLYGGSVAKHTYVDGLSDVDALVLLHETELAGKQPNELKKILADCLESRYGKGTVQQGLLAVTLQLDNQIIQLLPALRTGGKLKIADADGSGWSAIDPAGFADKLTKTNKALDGKLVPCIKLAKAIISQLPEQRRLTGYHVEALAIETFKGYTGLRTPKEMVRHFFTASPKHVTEPIKDSSGQSVHVDGYLGDANSLERRVRVDALGRIARRIQNADGAKSLESWRELFG